MRKFVTDELRSFLEAVDRNLSSPHRITVIGGTAAALAYRAGGGTRDIDIAENLPADLQEAITQARKETGFEIPVERPGVWDGPYNYEDRLELLDFGFMRLEISVPAAIVEPVPPREFFSGPLCR